MPTTQQDGDADMGKAYLDIAAAEQQAALLENQLRALESKIGAFLDEHDAPETTGPAQSSASESQAPAPAKEQDKATDTSSEANGV